jgi:hypothetical protein
MKTLRILLPIAALISAIPMTAEEMQPMPMPGKKSMTMGTRISPHETISQVINSCRVTITYGRPYSKDPRTGEIRKIWGGLVKTGHGDRLGADEATLLLNERPLQMPDGTVIPAGAHTLYIVLADDLSAKLAFSTNIGKWGIPVDETHDLARVDLKKDELPAPIDQLTLSVERNPGGGGVLKIKWETTQYSVAFTVVK